MTDETPDDDWPGGLIQVEPTDAEVHANRSLISLRPRIDALRVRFAGRPPKVKPFSTLAGDDRAAKPYQVSHAAWSAISHAIDNVVTAYDLTVIPKGASHYSIHTRPHAAYPVLRAAYENACRGLWLAGGPTRHERVERRLRMQLTDAYMCDEFAMLTRSAQGRIYGGVLEKLRPIAQANGTSNTRLKARVHYGTIVRGAAEAVGLEPDESEAIWRSLSGLAHGDYWAMLSVHERQEVSVSADGSVVTFLTSSPTTVVGSLIEVVAKKTEVALSVFDARASDRFSTEGI